MTYTKKESQKNGKTITKGRPMRFPSIVMYDDDYENKLIIEEHWKKLHGKRYSFAEVMRYLWRREAQLIQSGDQDAS